MRGFSLPISRTTLLRWLLLAGVALLVLGGIYASVRFKQPAMLALPLAGVLILQLLYDYTPLYYLMIASIPCSLAMELGGLGTDLPSEQLMWLFTGIFLLNVIAGKQFSFEKRLTTFQIWIFVLLFWALFCTITSEVPARSWKFWFAKFWYLAAWVWMAEKVLRDASAIRKAWWAMLLPMIPIVLFITYKHALKAFSFEASNIISQPFFVNHVIYGAAVVLPIPFAWYAMRYYSPRSTQWYLLLGVLLLLVLASALSFARGAWLATLLIPVIDFLIRRKIFDKLLYAGAVGLVLLLAYMLPNKNYYQFAPDYANTIFHEGDIEGHLEATFDGKDVSGMERFYRWTAAKNMTATRPLQGFGPSTFSAVYKRYTDDIFRTYVSENKEKSTTHNYFLMTFAEQGIIGGVIFLGLALFCLLQGYHAFHEAPTAELQGIAMAATLSLCTIFFHLLLNELVEVDKIGAFMWLAMVMIQRVRALSQLSI